MVCDLRVPMFPSLPVVEYDGDDANNVPISTLTVSESILRTATEKEMYSMPMPTNIDIPEPEPGMSMAINVQPANDFEHDDNDLDFEEAIGEAVGTPLEAFAEEPFKEAAKKPLIDQDESDLGTEEPLMEAVVTPLEAPIGEPVEDMIEQKAPTQELYPDNDKTVQT